MQRIHARLVKLPVVAAAVCGVSLASLPSAPAAMFQWPKSVKKYLNEPESQATGLPKIALAQGPTSNPKPLDPRSIGLPAPTPAVADRSPAPEKDRQVQHFADPIPSHEVASKNDLKNKTKAQQTGYGKIVVIPSREFDRTRHYHDPIEPKQVDSKEAEPIKAEKKPRRLVTRGVAEREPAIVSTPAKPKTIKPQQVEPKTVEPRLVQPPKPEVVERVQPKAIEAVKPKAVDLPRPKLAQKPQPTSALKSEPKLAQNPQPKTAQTPEPKVAQKLEPTTAQNPQPTLAQKIAQAAEPTIAAEPEPTLAHAPQPTVASVPEPSVVANAEAKPVPLPPVETEEDLTPIPAPNRFNPVRAHAEVTPAGAVPAVLRPQWHPELAAKAEVSDASERSNPLRERILTSETTRNPLR